MIFSQKKLIYQIPEWSRHFKVHYGSLASVKIQFDKPLICDDWIYCQEVFVKNIFSDIILCKVKNSSNLLNLDVECCFGPTQNKSVVWIDISELDKSNLLDFTKKLRTFCLLD